MSETTEGRSGWQPPSLAGACHHCGAMDGQPCALDCSAGMREQVKAGRETTEGVELVVPDAAVQALLNINPDYDVDDEAEADVRSIAIPVVAAELRRLAESARRRSALCRNTVGNAAADAVNREARELETRADELEAQS